MHRALTVAAFLIASTSGTVAAPALQDCARATDRQWCEEAHAMFLKHGGRPADYTGMRNIAYCQWTGCGGGFVVDRKEACALRRQIMKKYAGRTDRSDDTHFANCVSAGL